jgi:hypothetical protein
MSSRPDSKSFFSDLEISTMSSTIMFFLRSLSETGAADFYSTKVGLHADGVPRPSEELVE